jgi:hypothetical protein
VKAIIVDIKGRLAVAMKRGGEFVKVRNDGSFGIGDEIDLAKYSSVNAQALVRTASLAAIFLVVLGFGLGAYGYGRPYAYVGIDINPSVEMTVNFFDKIPRAKAILIIAPKEKYLLKILIFLSFPLIGFISRLCSFM